MKLNLGSLSQASRKRSVHSRGMQDARRLLQRSVRLESLESRQLMASDLHYYITTEHSDLAASYSTVGGWGLGLHEDVQGALPIDETAIYIGNNAIGSRPAGAAWDFIGVPANGTLYTGSQTEASGQVYLGANTSGVSPSLLNVTNPSVESKGRLPSSSNGRWVKYSMVDMDHFNPDGTPGTGSFSVWQNGSFGTPNPFISSYNDGVANPNGNGLDLTDGISADDALWLPAGSHAHYNFGFTQPGRYEVSMLLSANFVSGGVISSNPAEPFVLYFSVGSSGQVEFDGSSASIREDDASGTKEIRVLRTGGSVGELSVNYATHSGTATAGSDYVSSSGTLIFADQETEKWITIAVNDDSDAEANETLSLVLSNPGPEILEFHYSTYESRSIIGSVDTLTLSIIDNDSGANTPPTIDSIADQSTAEDTALMNVSMTINDAQTWATNLVVTAVSSDTVLFPSGSITLGGADFSRTISLTPAANQFGVATITVTVTDEGGLTATETFDVTVTPVNDAPTLGDIFNAVIDENSSFGPWAVVKGDVDDPVESVVLTATSSNPTLIPVENIQFSGTAANPILTIYPAAGMFGVSLITIIATDPHGLTAEESFFLTVRDVDSPPTPENDQFSYGGGTLHGNVLGNDSDPDSSSLTTSLASPPTHGTAQVFPNGAITYTAGAGFAGSDSFTYSLFDGFSSVTATVTISATEPATLLAGLVTGHADIGIAYEDGELEPHVHAHLEEEGGEEGGEEHEHGGLEYAPNEVLIQVQSEGAMVVPNDPAFAFVGAAPGGTIYVLPTAPQVGLPFIGFGTEEIAEGTFVGNIRLELVSVSGPGDFSIWDFDAVGALQVLMATSDGVTAGDVVELSQASHTHRNIGFSQPGNYDVTFRALAELADGSWIESEEATYLFAVATGRAPEITLAATERAYREQAAATQVDSTARVSDTDSSNFEGGSLRVDIPLGLHSDDVLSIRNQGTLNNQVSLSGNEVRVGVSGVPVSIGTWSGGTAGEPLVIELNANATAARLQLVMRAVMFSNMSDDPTAEHRVVRFVVADGDGEISDATIREVLVTPINDAPVLGLSKEAITYVENDAAVILDDALTLTDPDSPIFDGGRLSVSILNNRQTTDRLTIASQGDGAGEINVVGNQVFYEGVLIGTFTGGYTASTSLGISLNASATQEAVVSLARRIAFHNAGDNPTSLPRTVSFRVSDNAKKTSIAVALGVGVSVANDAPVINNLGNPVSYTQNRPAITVSSGATVVDPDSLNFDAGVLTVGLVSGGIPQDVLAIRSQGVGNGRINVVGNDITYGVAGNAIVIGTWAGGTAGVSLTVTFNSSATLAAVNATMRNVVFSVVGSTPTSTRTVRFSLTDGDGGVSPNVEKLINVIGTNIPS